MYKVIIDDKEVFSTDNVHGFINYCVDNNLIHNLVVELLPDNKYYTIELATQ
jgi:hypothetical protein